MTTSENSTSTRAENLAALAKIFQDYAGVDAEAVVPEAHVIDGLGVNSLALVEITIRTEDAFGVRLDDRTVAGFSTVGDLLDYLDSHGGSVTPAAK
ncbi:acyl carrier protein [Corynebacterium halotolerans]|uniref:acyl carrier protein n=1 Tax=Corynebacterium halotolerans TaxID=225326 RepID=UPI003CF168DC